MRAHVGRNAAASAAQPTERRHARGIAAGGQVRGPLTEHHPPREHLRVAEHHRGCSQGGIDMRYPASRFSMAWKAILVECGPRPRGARLAAGRRVAALRVDRATRDGEEGPREAACTETGGRGQPHPRQVRSPPVSTCTKSDAR